jgi:hypothetical protein
MPYVIGEACIDVLDRACVEERPMGGGTKLGRLGVDTALVTGYPPQAE